MLYAVARENVCTKSTLHVVSYAAEYVCSSMRGLHSKAVMEIDEKTP